MDCASRARDISLGSGLLIVMVGVACGAVGSLVARAAAWRFQIVNHPNAIVPQHTTATAYLGGLGVLFGIGGALVCAVVFGLQIPDFSLLLPAVLFCAFGLLDDLRPFKPLGKFVGQVAIASVALGLGLWIDITGIRVIDAALGVLWIVTMVNAFNFTDVCDGLVAGLTATCFLIAAVLGEGGAMAWAIAGACIGFLPFNAPKASMFLGDAGSHLLGFLVAAFLMRTSELSAAMQISQMVLVSFVPLFELFFVTTVRIEKGLPWWKGSPDHFALRLQRVGWSRWRVNVVAWLAMGVGGTLGWMLPVFRPAELAASAALAMICTTVAVRYLRAAEVSDG